MKQPIRQLARALAVGAVVMTGLAGPVAARDLGVGVGAPGAGVRDPGVNQPGAAGNRGAGAPGVGAAPGVGVGAPGVGVRDPGINQPGAAGNRGFQKATGTPRKVGGG